MEHSFKSFVMIVIVVILISIGLSNISFIKNQERTTAKIYDYVSVYDTDKDGEPTIMYRGLYKFTVDGESYKYEGKFTYSSKSIVPKTLKIIYNSENPNEFRVVIPPFVLSIVVTILTSVVLEIKNQMPKRKVKRIS